MYKDLKFPILIVHRDIKADTVAGDRVRGIARELEQEGFSISRPWTTPKGGWWPPPITAWRAC
jgi:arginine decarboxylase